MDRYASNLEIVDRVIAKVGKQIVLATPLGIGKPNHLLNAFYQRAKIDQEITLTICTALTLERPKGKSTLEQRFIDLFEERVFGNFPDLDYELDRVNGRLPPNIKVIEFYFAPGKYLNNPEAQMNYISTNYTHVARDVMDRGVNVLAQSVAKKEVDSQTYLSLSSNPDVTLEMSRMLQRRKTPYSIVAEVNQYLPFMYGDGKVKENFFDYISDDPKNYYTLFGPPKMSIPDADFIIGLYCSALIKDDGEIQIGIGSLGDATIYNLLLRQTKNSVYKEICEALKLEEKFSAVMKRCGDTKLFKRGLFGASEMIVDGFQHLYTNGIIKKKVYDHYGLQLLLNKELISEIFDDNILKILWKNKLIHERISLEDFDFLVQWGIFKNGLTYSNGYIVAGNGQSISPNINDPANQEFIKKHCLGTHLKNGQVMHGGFFLGPNSFYKWLRELPEEERKRIHMKSVQKINQLYGHERLDRLHRKNARFINTCMMYTLGGAAVSDGFEDGKVVSGVGGQYNFVAMAQELPDGHSILNLRSTRKNHGRPVSNILPFYGHITIPKHLRDIVVTEYGIAFIRGKTDEEIIIELLKITDSRFQKDLLLWAKKVGKLNPVYELPERFKNNHPSTYLKVIEKFRQKGLYPKFPFGTELTEDEIILGRALKELKADSDSKFHLLKTFIKGLLLKPDNTEQRLLQMMKLNGSNFKEKLFNILLRSKLRKVLSTS